MSCAGQAARHHLSISRFAQPPRNDQCRPANALVGHATNQSNFAERQPVDGVRPLQRHVKDPQEWQFLGRFVPDVYLRGLDLTGDPACDFRRAIQLSINFPILITHPAKFRIANQKPEHRCDSAADTADHGNLFQTIRNRIPSGNVRLSRSHRSPLDCPDVDQSVFI